MIRYINSEQYIVRNILLRNRLLIPGLNCLIWIIYKKSFSVIVMKRIKIFLNLIIILLLITSYETYSQSGNAKSLEIGDKWIYRMSARYNGEAVEYSYRNEEIINDTIIKNKIYAVVSHAPIYGHSYERADSKKIYFYDTFYDSEDVFVNFNQKDTLFEDGSSIRVDTINYWGRVRIRITNDSGIYTIGSSETSFLEGIGEEGYGYTSHGGSQFGESLVAAYLNGVKYGDTILVDVKRNEQLPAKFELFQNYPNPFNSKTIIKLTVPEPSKVILSIYSVLGDKIIDLVNKEFIQGNYQVEFDGSNISSGIYFYQLRTKNFIKSKKLVLLK